MQQHERAMTEKWTRVEYKYNKELRLIIQAQWDNEHNTVEFGNDRQ